MNRNKKRISPLRSAAAQALESLESRMLMTGSVLATVTLDSNHNGSPDPGEPGLRGWAVYVDYNDNSVRDATEPQALTDATGHATITNVATGSNVVREVIPAGYTTAAGFKDFDHVSVKDGRTDTVSFLNVPLVATTGTIQGSVWNDIAGDGLRDPSDPGIPGWTVYLDTNTNRFLDPGEPTAITDATGSFTFANLAPGKYTVREITPAGWDPTLGADGKVSSTVTAGNTANVSFGNFNAVSLGTITGSVWNDVNADGLRGAGDPGLGGWTLFLDTNGDNLLSPGESTAVTDASGIYSFPTVTVGTYRVAEVLQSGWNLSPGHPLTVTVTVANETPGRADFANFTPALGSISGTVWNDTDGNGLIGPAEIGIPDRTVFIDQNANGSPDAGELQALTDGLGNYTITDVPIGSAVVRTIPPVGSTATAPGTGMQLVTVLNASVVTAINFGSKQRTDSSIAGTVFVDSNHNGLRDPGEPGLAGIPVFLDLNANGTQDPGEPATTSSADLFYTPTVNEAGAYQFTHLPTGTYHVRQTVTDLLSATPSASRDLLVDLVAGQARAGIDFADVYRANEIHGAVFDDLNHNHVMDAGETGIAGVTVYVDTNRNNLADPGEPTTVTAPDGSYSFLTSLSPGSYVVRALHFSGREDTYPTTTAGILWPTGISNPAVGNVSPTSITTSLAKDQTESHTVALTLPTAGSLSNRVDVFLLFDDTGSFTANSPIVRAAFPQIIASLQAAMPTVDFGFGVGRFEEYANFAAEFSTGRPFILNQPIIDQSTPGFSLAIQSALDRTAPGYGGDQPETDIEALFQMATGAGFDGNNNGTTTDSGAAGQVATQLTPGPSGDVPSFGSFTVDPAGNVLPPAGNIGGAGFRPGALPIILVATDTGFAFQPFGETSVTGAGGLTLPISSLTQTSRPTTPFNSGAGIQQTVDALNALGALVIGLGTEGATTIDPRQDLESLAKLIGAINRSTTTIPNGTLTPIAPGAPLYFQIASGFGPSVANGIVTAIENATSAVSVDLTLQASDPSVHIVATPTVIHNVTSGQTATFDVTFTGDGRPHRFDLQFVRQGTGVVLGSIPVVIGTPIAGEGYEYVELEDGQIQHAEDFGDAYNPLLPTNSAPDFHKGPNQQATLNSGHQDVAGWATSITPGPAADAGQLVTFTLSTDNPSLFAQLPTLSPDGTLHYTPAPNATGTATITVTPIDTGGTVAGGIDTGLAQSFAISIAPLLLSLPATAGNDNFDLRLADGRLQVFSGATLLYDVAPNTLGPITFAAGLGADTLSLTGDPATADDLVLTPTDLTLGGISINFNNLESIRFDGRGGDDHISVSAGSPALTLTGNQRLASLSVDSSQVSLTPGGATTLFTRALSLTNAARLDLADNSLLLDYDAASPINDIRSALLAGGIFSSFANPTHAIGYAESADLGLTSFAAQPVDPTALLLQYTLQGDANLDGKLNADDYALADRGLAKHLGTWLFGDFNYDGLTTPADLTLLNQAASLPAPPAPSVTPDVITTISVPSVTVDNTATAALTPTAPPVITTPTPARTTLTPAPAKPTPAPTKHIEPTHKPKPAPKPSKHKPAPKPIPAKRPLVRYTFSSLLIRG